MKLITFSQLRPEKGIVYSRVHLMRKVNAGEFPKPINLSDARVAWIEAEIDKWISDLAELRTAKAAA